jgi:asparagine N-glycosylation enzyme membrane subunit Stt3
MELCYLYHSDEFKITALNLLPKFADVFMRVLIVAVFFVLLLAPGSYFAFILGIASLIAMGLWAVWLPAGIINWARTAHPQLREDDESVISVARFIGKGFIVMGLLILLALVYRR